MLMLPNGMIITLDRAVGNGFAAHPHQARCYGLWVMGAMREDVIFVPGADKALPSPSVGHIYPWVYYYFLRLYRRAVRQMRAGHFHKAHFSFGRALHVLIDVACPSHALPVWHCWRDPFERFVESHATEIMALPVPVLPNEVQSSPRRLLHHLIRAARCEQGDYTQSPLGRWLRRKGLRTKPQAAVLRAQAFRLMPLAVAHVRALLACFERDTGKPVFVASPKCVLTMAP